MKERSGCRSRAWHYILDLRLQRSARIGSVVSAVVEAKVMHAVEMESCPINLITFTLFKADSHHQLFRDR